jgi:hypothetical protein
MNLLKTVEDITRTTSRVIGSVRGTFRARHRRDLDMSISVVVADDSELIQDALARLLKDHPEIKLLGRAGSFTETLQLIGQLQAHLVVMDLHMKDGEHSRAFRFQGASERSTPPRDVPLEGPRN